MHTIRRAFAASVAAVASAAGQPASVPTSPPPPPASALPAQPAGDPKGVPFEALPPGLKMAARLAQARSQIAVAPIVVVVHDAVSYVEAIGRWTLAMRFPVLIDDGTPQATEDIGRFVRAFEPRKVVRWASGEPLDWLAHEITINNAIGRAWTVDGVKPAGGFGQAEILEAWRTVKLTPPGVIVSAKDDGIWTAAVALAAGRGQPILWTKSSKQVNNPMDAAECDRLEKQIEEFCAKLGYSWDKPGDNIDAVTICMTERITVRGAKGIEATTDRIGRKRSGPNDADRWAWCGQIVAGSHARSAAIAMASLFLQPKEARVFDSYPDSPGWKEFDGGKAADVLRKAGLAVQLTDRTKGNEAEWRAMLAKPRPEDLFLVNTKGNKNFFDLAQGQGLLGDLPILVKPSAVHFVHSFSAQFLGTRDTLAGRWLDRGAYLYLGSVDEPTLSAFVPTPVVAARLAAGMPWAMAVRFDAAPVWKLCTLGDPLASFGKPAPRTRTDPDLGGEMDLAERAAELVKESKFEAAIAAFIMTGKDSEAAKLGGALLKLPEKATPAALAMAVMPMFRSGAFDDLVIAMGKLKRGDVKVLECRDALWIVAGPRAATGDEAAMAALRLHARPEQIDRDMKELGEAVRKKSGAGAAIAALTAVKDSISEDLYRKEAEKTLLTLRTRWGN